MTERAEARLDGTTLIVRIPMRFQRRGGRKRIVAPYGSEIVSNSKPLPDSTLVKALARAWRWQRLLEGADWARWPSWRVGAEGVLSEPCRSLRLDPAGRCRRSPPT